MFDIDIDFLYAQAGPYLRGLRDQTQRNGDLKFLAQIQYEWIY